MQKTLLISLIAILFVGLTSCDKTDLTPAYIYITEEDFENCVDVSTFNADHDLNFDSEQLNALKLHSFTHVNVTVNNKNLGCWQLPCKIPVLGVNENDSSSLELVPCFKMTGMNHTIKGYPFFERFKQKIMLRKNETYNVSSNPPKFKYSQYAHFPLFETFSNSSSFTPTDSTNTHNLFPTIVDGRTVGEVVLENDSAHFDLKSVGITMPTYNYRVFLEVNYMTEGDLEIGMQLSTAQYPNTVYPLGGIYASNGEWKTIYFELTNIIHSYNNYTGAAATVGTLFFSGIGNAGGAPTHFYIDNVKVIYQPGS